MFEILGGIVASVLSGGATGLLGVLIQRFFDMKSKGQDLQLVQLNHQNAKDLKQMEIEGQLKIVTSQSAAQLAVAKEVTEQAQVQALAQERAAAAEEYAASVAADRAMYLDAAAQRGSKSATFMMGMVDWVRGMTRPILTAYLVVITHLMFNWVQALAEKNGASLTSAELKEIIHLVLSTILYLATVAVVWWFGTRPPKHPKAK